MIFIIDNNRFYRFVVAALIKNTFYIFDGKRKTTDWNTKGLCTLSPKCSHAFFKIRNPKNSTESDTYSLICYEKISKTVAY